MQSGFPEKIVTTNIAAIYNRETIGDIKVEKNSVTLVEFLIRPSCCMMTSLAQHNTKNNGSSSLYFCLSTEPNSFFLEGEIDDVHNTMCVCPLEIT